ncbi:hypothetical protein ACJMK2_025279 [Sinanodonta woodiana]|uniref:Protein AAR2 homolog n=1 Tax=Sinanodonta woodiana TaxID=1069815 RepID=A0ABD3XJP5_SINWO
MLTVMVDTAREMACKMDPETAKVLFKEGATLLFFDVPEGTEFGIDYNSWTVGPNFQGVKMIPPGIHFVYYSSRSNNGDTGPRTGFFYNFQRQEIIVRKWDKYNEDVKTDPVSEDEVERYRKNMENLDRFLGPYPYENYKKWVSMSSYVTADLLNRLQPENRRISSVTEFISEASDSKSRLAAMQSKMETESDSRDKLPELTTKPEAVVHFTKLHNQRYPQGSSPDEITKHSLDSSYVLEQTIKSSYQSKEMDLLGEIQFSFICFLIGQVYDAFDQWKKLVHLMCNSKEALEKHNELYMNLISVLHYQIREIPEDFFVDIVSQHNFLTNTLHEFFCNIEYGNPDVALKRRALKFRDHLTVKFKWDFTSEPDDFAPVVVE